MSSETRIPLHKLNQPCSQLLERVVLWLLGLSTTQQAIAEIIDNMPISSHFFGRHNICDQPHPEIQRRLKPSDQAVKLASELCKTLDPRTLPVDAQTAKNFEKQLSSAGYSSALRLLEITSVIIHDFASNLHGKFHRAPSFSPAREPVRLEHQSYVFVAGYRNEVMSKVGYWAETVIFGGPMLFAKGSEGNQCGAAFIHPPGEDIGELAEAQIMSFWNLFTTTVAADTNTGEKASRCQPSPVLPFQVIKGARRLTKGEAIAQHVYRDPGQLSSEADYRESLSKRGPGRCVEL